MERRREEKGSDGEVDECRDSVGKYRRGEEGGLGREQKLV